MVCGLPAGDSRPLLQRLEEMGLPAATISRLIRFATEEGCVLSSWGVPEEIVRTLAELRENVWIYVAPLSGPEVEREASRGVAPRENVKVIHSKRGAL